MAGVKAISAEGISGDDYSYYYNIETGKSKLEKPDDFIPHIGNLCSDKVIEKSLGVLKNPIIKFTE